MARRLKEIEQELAVLLLGTRCRMRSSAWLALLACKVARQRCPVSANWMANSMVSWERISPMRMTSGAWRRGVLRATSKDAVSIPTLPLGHQTAIVLMDELHRILHRQDVAVTVLVAKADHGRLGGGLAGASGADEEHQPAFGHGDLLQDGRQHQLVKGGDAGLDAAQHHARHILLPEGADPKAPQRASLDGVVGLAGVQEALEVGLVQALP